MQKLSSFKEIVKKYRALFFDASGVLKTEQSLLAGVADLFVALRQSGKMVWILSNDASRSPEECAEKYVDAKAGQLISAGEIITSGMLAAKYLKEKCAGLKVAYLGPKASEYYICKAGNPLLPLCEVTDPQWPDVIMLMDNAGFEWKNDLTYLVNIARKRPEVRLLAPNPDLVFPVRDGRLGIASGALAKMLELVVDRPFTSFGKPNREMFDFGFKLAEARMPGIRHSEMLMVGDTMATDIAGANRAGIHSVLVLTGNTTMDNYDTEGAKAGCAPTYVAQSVIS